MKLDRNAIREMKESMMKPVPISVIMNQKEYTIIVETAMTSEVQVKMMGAVSIMTEDHLLVHGDQVIGLFALIKTLTDIEWENDMEKDMETFTYLLNNGTVNKILDAVPKELITEMTAYMGSLTETLNQIAEEEQSLNEDEE